MTSAGVLLQSFRDLFFPPRCLACDAPAWAGALCPRCGAGMPAPVERCPRCARRLGPVQALVNGGCPRCTGPFATDDPLSVDDRPGPVARVVAAYPYAGPPRELVLALKFRSRAPVASLLADALADALWQARIPGDLIVPVPLGPRRERVRGYNQSVLLARPLARRVGVAYSGRALRRVRETRPQTELTRSGRRRAQQGAYRADATRVEGRCVLLVDDVLTTGATARACALALRRAGASAVVAAVVCRAELG